MSTGAAVVEESKNRSNVTQISSVPSEGKEAGKWTRFFTIEGKHPFAQIEWKIANAKITNTEGDIVFEQRNIEVPAWWDQTTINIVADKYFRTIEGIRESSVKQIFTRVSNTLTQWAKEQGYFETDEDAVIFEQELIYALLHQYGGFNSPVWFNIGVPGRKQTASACFISSVDDSLQGIIGFQSSELEIFKGGSGSGANLSNLRSSYEKISAGSYTSGPLAFMKGADAYAGAMKSGGATRNAAKIVILDIDHPDILKTRDGRPGFIKCKAVEEKRAHDLIEAGYSAAYDDPNSAYKNVSYQNANHSVSVSDEFMKAVQADGAWHTRERVSEKTIHVLNAKELWNEIAEAAWFCGDPGLQFSDTINRWHTTPSVGKIRSSNPCGEFLNVDNTACNLCAINLVKFFDGNQFDVEKFGHTIRVFVTAQNAIISKADYPTEIIKENSHQLRPIGLNYGNLGALLMRLGYGYDSDEGRVIAARLASLMTGFAYDASAKLAARVGPFPKFGENSKAMLDVMRMHRVETSNICRRWNQDTDPLGLDTESMKLWNNVIELGEKFGFTVSQATLQAPLGTLSFLLQADTTGIEPAVSLVSYKSLVGGGYEKLINKSLGIALKNLGYSDDKVRTICEYVEKNGFIEGAPDFNPNHLSIFDCALPAGPTERHLQPMAHVKMLAAIQPMITCAQSKTINLPESTTPQEIADLYMESWKLGLKSVTIYRNGSKKSQPLSTKSSDQEKKAEEESVVVAERRPMPVDCKGSRHRFEIGGHKGYIVMNEYPDGTLGEVFLKLGKSGSTMGSLIDGFTQLLSIALQHGVPLENLINSFIHTKFEPAGMTLNPEIRFTDSIYDYLFKLLDLHYFDGANSGINGHHDVEAADASDSAPVSDRPSMKPPVMSLDAPSCGQCGAIMRRNGSCYLCDTCGHSSGCS
jgi:ribonucleoside-diphosphate reductase alpha chain